jgi:hypothetical protein
LITKPHPFSATVNATANHVVVWQQLPLAVRFEPAERSIGLHQSTEIFCKESGDFDLETHRLNLLVLADDEDQ